MATSYKASPLKSLASLSVTKLFWNASCQSEDIKQDEVKDNRDQNWELRLIRCRNKSIKLLNTLIEKKNLPSCLKSALMENIFYFFKGYHQFFSWKNTYDLCNKIKLLGECEMYAPNFFTVSGDFDDDSFARRFVENPNNNIISRFCLACLYWLEDKSETIWLELKSLYGINTLNFIVGFWRHGWSLIFHRIIQIEYETYTSKDILTYQENFWEIGFEIALEGGFVHVVVDFWLKFVDEYGEESALSFMERDTIFEFMSKSINYPFNHIRFFLFCTLFKESIDDLVEWTSINGKHEAWYNRLFTEKPGSIIDPSDEYIMNLIPKNLYSSLLTSLAQRIWRFQDLADIKSFILLSKKLNDREMELILLNDVLKCVPDFLEILAKAKTIYALKCIVFCLSLEQKNKLLLNNLYGGGITAIKILSKEREFEMINDYLQSFLIDTGAGKRRLRKDASLILRRFRNSLPYKLWCEKEICKKYVKEVNDRIVSLQATLAILDEICEKVCNKASKYKSLLTSSLNESIFPQNEQIDLSVRFRSRRKCRFKEQFKHSKLHKSN